MQKNPKVESVLSVVNNLSSKAEKYRIQKNKIFNHREHRTHRKNIRTAQAALKKILSLFNVKVVGVLRIFEDAKVDVRIFFSECLNVGSFFLVKVPDVF